MEPKTLKERLDECIEAHGLGEVLDRITDLTHEKCRHESKYNCDNLTDLLERATREALLIDLQSAQ